MVNEKAKYCRKRTGLRHGKAKKQFWHHQPERSSVTRVNVAELGSQ
jgi:hypothetical protein